MRLPRLATLSATFLTLFLAGAAPARSGSAPRAPSDLETKTWTVDGVPRTALVYLPPQLGSQRSSTQPAPIIFNFHGHGGTSRFASRAAYEKLWPEAIVVYPQGLPTAGMTDPDGKLPGWQQKAGDQNDRDLKFFDTMLASFKKDYPVDNKRIFSTGHSNGGKFTYLLWETRAPDIAAFAPSAAPVGITVMHYTPKPLFHIGSPEDQIVPFKWQQNSINAILKLNNCNPTPTKWQTTCDWYDSKSTNTSSNTPPNTPVVTLIHHGGHTVPKEAPALIVQFFKTVTNVQ